MNGLEYNDGYLTTSQEERQELIELFKYNGITVSQSTWSNRQSLNSYETLGVIRWCTHVLIGYRTNCDNVNLLTREEFLEKAGLHNPVQGDSKLIHKFIR